MMDVELPITWQASIRKRTAGKLEREGDNLSGSSLPTDRNYEV
jgi:hypothetical protein